jgi:glutamate synthase (NADPH/NADH) small chain
MSNDAAPKQLTKMPQAASGRILARLGLHRPELRAWALYDWANSAVVTTIIAAVFPIYFYRVAGANLPQGAMNIPGEHLGEVYSANEFLTRVNLMKAYDPRHYDSPVYDCADRDVGVIGGGNTAMNAVRCALRVGAKNARIIYRRSEAEMPARLVEIHHAKSEGVQFMTLHNPLEFIGNDQGFLTGVRLQKMELGEPDESGRRRPVPVVGSEFVAPIDVAVIAVGTGANALVQSTTPDIQTNKWRYIVADQETLRTTKRGVFAGGDIVSRSATVILAMGAGRVAAKSIHEFLTTSVW